MELGVLHSPQKSMFSVYATFMFNGGELVGPPNVTASPLLSISCSICFASLMFCSIVGLPVCLVAAFNELYFVFKE